MPSALRFLPRSVLSGIPQYAALKKPVNGAAMPYGLSTRRVRPTMSASDSVLASGASSKGPDPVAYLPWLFLNFLLGTSADLRC